MLAILQSDSAVMVRIDHAEDLLCDLVIELTVTALRSDTTRHPYLPL
jgi:hypothetical protein